MSKSSNAEGGGTPNTRSGAIQGIPNNNGRSMISISADPARFPQLSAALVFIWITHGGNAVAGAMFNFSIKVDTR